MKEKSQNFSLPHFPLFQIIAHLKTHCGEKWNECNQCDFASFWASNLRTHLKTHSGEKPNKCNQCDYASYRAGHLRTHLKMHSGEKSNKCNQCVCKNSNVISHFFRVGGFIRLVKVPAVPSHAFWTGIICLSCADCKNKKNDTA